MQINRFVNNNLEQRHRRTAQVVASGCFTFRHLQEGASHCTSRISRFDARTLLRTF
jgi:hypothetical protein